MEFLWDVSQYSKSRKVRSLAVLSGSPYELHISWGAMSSYFDAPPGQRVLRKFTVRRDTLGGWLVIETPSGARRSFETSEAAERFALREAEGDRDRIYFPASFSYR
jgi:hypothetical protein